MISTKSKYALKAMIDIAVHKNSEEYISIKEIAKREDISLKYLEQVISLLIKGRLLISVRGSNGGYRLVKKPEEYTALEIITATDGDITRNLYDDGSTKKFFEAFAGCLSTYLSNVTLEDLVNDYHEVNKVFDYSI